MLTAPYRTVTRLLIAAFLLLVPGNTIGHAGILVHRPHGAHPSIGAANHSVLLPAIPQTTSERKDVDTAPQPLLAFEASLRDRRAESTPAPTCDSMSLCSYERTTDEA